MGRDVLTGLGAASFSLTGVRITALIHGHVTSQIPCPTYQSVFAARFRLLLDDLLRQALLASNSLITRPADKSCDKPVDTYFPY